MLDSYGAGQKSDASVPNASTTIISDNIKSGSNASHDFHNGPMNASAQINNNLGIAGANEHHRDKFEFNSNQLKDKLNITNSLIISNSQILF